MGSALRFAFSLCAVGGGLVASLALLDALGTARPDAAVQAASVAVREEKSEEAKSLDVQIEKEKKRIEKELREEFARQLEQREKEFRQRLQEVSGLRAETDETRQAVARQTEALEKERRRLEEKTEKVAELEKKVSRREEELRSKEEEAAQRQEALEKLEERLRQRETEAGKKEEKLSALATELLHRQEKLEASKEAEAKEHREREAELSRLAGRLTEQQAELRKERAEQEKEWRRVKEAYRRVEAKEKDLAQQVEKARASAGEWEKLRAEWKKIEEERAKLEEAAEVKRNVEDYRRSFDEKAYARRLEALMQGTALKEVESRFIPFRFFAATDEAQKDQLRLFGIRDVYMNLRSKKYVVVTDYASGSFSSQGTWSEKEMAERFPDCSIVILERKPLKGFYLETLRRARRVIGGSASDAYVFGLMPKVMVYEIYLHQQRVMELRKLDRRDIVTFTFAPFRHQGRWRFKVFDVTVRGPGGAPSVRTVGNYSF